MQIPTKILAPTDFSEFSSRALGQALDIAKLCNAKVFLVYVVHHPMIHAAELESTLSEEVMLQINEKTFAWAQENFQKQLNRFPQAKEVEVITSIRQGLPYEEILKEAKDKGIDLIVIASSGRSGLTKYLVGSVARNVLKGSKCPVLLIK